MITKLIIDGNPDEAKALEREIEDYFTKLLKFATKMVSVSVEQEDSLPIVVISTCPDGTTILRRFLSKNEIRYAMEKKFPILSWSC